VYCTNCGNELDSAARFCSTCGSDLAQIALPPDQARDWDLHVKVLGWLVIAHAALTGLLGLAVMFAGQFLQRFILNNPGVLDHVDPNDVPPPEVIGVIGPLAFFIGVILLMVATPSVAAGVGLLRYRSWGRVLTLVLSFLRLLEFPFGTATAVYSFWVLLSRGGKTFYSERAAQAEV
jgi:hypothetical protein